MAMVKPASPVARPAMGTATPVPMAKARAQACKVTKGSATATAATVAAAVASAVPAIRTTRMGLAALRQADCLHSRSGCFSTAQAAMWVTATLVGSRSSSVFRARNATIAVSCPGSSSPGELVPAAVGERH